MHNIKPFIMGVAGVELSAQECDFITQHQPWGFILFARNCSEKAQISELVAHLKSLVAHDNVPVLIDQEGGRVARLTPPIWQKYPPAAYFGALAQSDGMVYAQQVIYDNFRAIADDLSELGINVNCAPMVDVFFDGGDNIIGDRALGVDPDMIACLAREICRGLMDGKVLPIIKHIPGHGRANCDSHKALPIVDAALSELRAVDFAPFRALADMPMAMTAHIVYSAIDPVHCATVSSKVIGEIRTEIGFNNLLMTDDLSMHALEGSFEERTQQSLAAGCDVVLHCNGKMAEMQAIVAELDIAPQGTVNKMQSMWKLLG